MDYETIKAESLAPPSKYTRFHLPGFTLPLKWEPRPAKTVRRYENLKSYCYELGSEGYGENLFPTALNAGDLEGDSPMYNMTTLRELTMIHIMNEITDKHNWEEKVFDEEIVSRWREEVRQGNDVTDRMMDYVIAELRFTSKKFRETGILTVYDGGIIKSDSAVAESIRLALKEAVQPLEDGPEKDYHPGSDEKVLDLVHPSLFPVVYGRTRILRDEIINLDHCLSNIGRGEVLPAPQSQDVTTERGRMRNIINGKSYSDKFQWLPCDVELTGEAGCKITSYINNLHPVKHKAMYPILEDIIASAIPLWNLSLTPWDRKCYGARRLRIKYEEAEYEPLPEDERPQQRENEQRVDFMNRVSEWERSNRVVILPEPEEFIPHDYFDKVDIRKLAGERGLQVIVKLANIELTPEKPAYGGGSWHVEGQMNEHICATALYYYDSENITESRLSFRQGVYDDDANEVSYEQDLHDWLEAVFGCEQYGPAVQDVGSVLCKQGRLLTFPNVLQHRVSPFRLADPTKPGHRKIVALFLIDPNIRVISTANVPPQRRDWWMEELHRKESLGRFPPELQNMVTKELDFPMDMDEAKKLRLELMDERRAFVTDQTSVFTSNTFSLCEH